MHLKWRGALLVAISSMLFGFMGFLGTQLFNLNFSVENMLFWRFLIATAWIFLSSVLLRKWQAQAFIEPKSILKIFILGALSYSGGSVFYFLASKQIGTGPAMAIFFSFPVFVALLAWMLGTWKMNKIAFIALLAVVSGLILLKGHGATTLSSIGIVFAISAGGCYATYVYGSQHTIKNIDAHLLTLAVCLGNTLIFFILSWYTHTLMLPTNWQAWFYICAIGIVATAMPIQLLLNGLKYISPVNAAILSVFEPAVTLLIGFSLLHETISYMQALGVMIILLGAILIQFEAAPKEERDFA